MSFEDLDYIQDTGTFCYYLSASSLFNIKRMDLRDYHQLKWDVHLREKCKHFLFKSRNSKKDLRKIFRPRPDISLFYTSVQCSNTFATYLIRFAIENDVDSNLLLSPVGGNNPLRAAVLKGNFKLVEMIVKYATDHGHQNAALLARDSPGCEPPFQKAVLMEDIRSMDAIFRFGVENGVDAVKMLTFNKKGSTALRYAIRREIGFHVIHAVVTLATDNGVNADLLFQADKGGMTPLHLTSRKTFDWVNFVIKVAKECGVGANSLIGPDNTGNSPLHYAAMNSDVDSVKAILTFATDSGVDASSLLQPNANGRTPLHYAAMNEFGDTFDTILTWAMSNGVPLVPLFEADPKGRTPLHLMVNYQNLSYAEAAKKIFQIAHSCGQLPVLLRTDWTENTLLNFYVCLQFKELLYNQIILEPWIWPALFPSQSSVALRDSVHSGNTGQPEMNKIYSDPPPDEVLFKIFEYLDLPDLNNCEMVCRRWRDILLKNISWSKLLERMCTKCALWRRIQKIMEEENGQFPRCGSRKKCQMISKKFQELDNNWKTGRYQMRFESFYRNFGLKYDEDYILAQSNLLGDQFTIINRRTMRSERELNCRLRGVSDFQIYRNIIVIASNDVIAVFDAATAEQVNVIVVPNNYQVVNLCFRHGLLVALSESSRNLPNRCQLTVWRVNSSTDIRHLVDLPMAGDEHHNRKTGVAMDENYIAIFLQMKQCTKIDFVSTKSLIVEDSRTVDATEGHILRYHFGLLITKNGNCIGLRDVFTDDLREINLEPFGLGSECAHIQANSKYFAVMSGQAEWTKVGIFDLRAAGNTTGCYIPLCSFYVPFEVLRFEMDETELICFGLIPAFGVRMVVIDFLSTPAITDEGKMSSAPILNGDETGWWLAFCKEMIETNLIK